MLPNGFSLPSLLFNSLLVTVATLNLIHAGPHSEDLFSGDYSSIEPNLDDMYYEPNQPDSLLPDPVSESSLTAIEFSDLSSSEAPGSSTWDSPSEVFAPDVADQQSSCETQSKDDFGDNSPADDEMLQARGNDAETCADPERDQKIDQNTHFQPFKGQGIPPIFAPVDLTKPDLGLIPPDPSGSFIKAYGNCFLPYGIRCCCYGSYTWGEISIWGPTLEVIEQCSVGT